MVTEQRRETAVAVVVVDDEESIREGCRQTLDAQGYRTSVAEDGLKGLRMVEQVKPGVVLVDLKMPGMDGLEVLKRIRQIDPHVAMIVITGYATVESAVTAMKIGACDYLNKPFKTEKLLSVVAEGVERNRLGKRVASLESERKQALNNFAADVTVVERPKAFEVATKVLTARGLASFVERMIADRSVICVRTKEPTEDHFVFASLEGASQLRLDYDVTILPPKKYLLPPCEVLVEFELGGDPKARPRVEAGAPTVLIGVHPYDMIAINQLDVLMSQTNPDPNYLARRGMLTIIGVDPVRASKKAFWGGMGCDVVENGFDLWLTDIGGAYVVEVDSEKGAALLDKYTEAQDATEEQLQARSKARAKAKEFGSTRQLDFRPAELPGLLRRFFDHGVWAKQALTCLSCGSCNLVCPTCYCFDVRDDVDISLKTGRRERIWDGCLLEDFAKVGTGENFREDRLQRYRHRFYRKGMYLYDKCGQIACVGCGRCSAACLPDIADPVTVYNTLKEGN